MVKKKKSGAGEQRAGKTELLAIVGLSGLIVLPVSIAAAQQESVDFRDMTVLQRPREDFDPKGIPVGTGFRFMPSLDVQENYTDNLYAANTNQVDDFQTTISPKVALNSNWSRHSLSVSGYANIHRYINRGTEDNDEYGAKANLGLDLAHGGTLSFEGGYDHTTIARGDPEERRALTPEEVGLTHGNVQWQQQFSFLLLGATAQYLEAEEDSDLNRDKNYKAYTGSFRVGYVFSPALSVFIEPNYTDYDYHAPIFLGGFDRDSETMGINAGAAYDITGVLYGETRIGWYRAGFKDPRIKSDSGISVQSKTTWNPTARDSIIFTLVRQSVPTNDPNSSSRVRTGGDVEFQHELTRNIVLRLDAGYHNDKFVESTVGREEDVIDASIRGDYYLNRYLSFYMSYTYTNLDSTVKVDSYDENQIMIGIHTQI
jgi:hypothetical protein